jgi:hypothetical protein
MSDEEYPHLKEALEFARYRILEGPGKFICIQVSKYLMEVAEVSHAEGLRYERHIHHLLALSGFLSDGTWQGWSWGMPVREMMDEDQKKESRLKWLTETINRL